MKNSFSVSYSSVFASKSDINNEESNLDPISSSLLIDLFCSKHFYYFGILLTSVLIGASTGLIFFAALAISTATVFAVSASIGAGIGAAALNGIGLSLITESVANNSFPYQPDM